MRDLKIFESPRRARKKLAALAITGLAAVGVGAALLGSASAATTWTVNDDMTGPGTCTAPDFSTIQDAINDPGVANGDTIQVCAGTYSAVDVTKSVTLNGAQAGVDARSGRGLVSDESVVADTCGPVRIMADKVIIDGFTIEGSTDSDPCFLAGIWTNPGFSATQGGHKIYNNIVQNNISGLELDNTGTFPTEVKQNLFRNNTNPGPGSGNAIQVNFGLVDALIDSNKFQGHTSSSFGNFAASSDITFSGNELVGGTSERVLWFSVADSTISGNSSNGSTSSGVVRLAGGNSGISVTGNDLANGMRGVRVDNAFGGPNSDVTVNGNNLTGNSLAGLQVDAGGYSGSPGSLDGTCNWWNSASGPTHAGNPGGTGDAVVDPDGVVDYTPWLTAPAPSGPCDGPLPQQMERKEAVRDSLAALLPTGNKKDDHEIKEAIKHLDKSLDPDLWVDENHLDPKHGHKVFDEERNAVKHLEKVVPPPDVTTQMDEIVDIDHDLAETAINEIPPATNPSRQDKVDKETAKANEELAKGDAYATAGDRDKAIEHYKKAWEHAQHATKEANKA